MDPINEADYEAPSEHLDAAAVDEDVERNPQEELAIMASLVAGENSSSSSFTPLVKRARKLLFRNLRVGVEDGRVFVGKFHCLDKQGNIILYDTLEFRQIAPANSPTPVPAAAGAISSSADGMEQRSLGLVLIPARCRTSCFVECSLHEQLSLLSI